MKLADGRELITPDDAGKILGVTPGRIWHFLIDERLTIIRIPEIPRRAFIDKTEVMNFRAERKKWQKSEPRKKFKIPW